MTDRRRGRNADSPEGTKWCNRCGRYLPLSDFYRNRRRADGLHSWCKTCHGEECRTRENTPAYKARVRAWHVRNPERTEMSVKPARKLYWEIKAGRVVKPDSCSQCGRTSCRIEAAHHDYSKPDEYVWLCSRCHAKWDHAQPKTVAATEGR